MTVTLCPHGRPLNFGRRWSLQVSNPQGGRRWTFDLAHGDDPLPRANELLGAARTWQHIPATGAYVAK